MFSSSVNEKTTVVGNKIYAQASLVTALSTTYGEAKDRRRGKNQQAQIKNIMYKFIGKLPNLYATIL